MMGLSSVDVTLMDNKQHSTGGGGDEKLEKF